MAASGGWAESDSGGGELALHASAFGVEFGAFRKHAQQVGDPEGRAALGQGSVVAGADRLDLRVRHVRIEGVKAAPEPAEVGGDQLDRPGGGLITRSEEPRLNSSH